MKIDGSLARNIDCEVGDFGVHEKAQHFGDFHRNFKWQAQHFRRVVLRVFANRNVRAASSGDNVQMAWQVQGIVSVILRRRGSIQCRSVVCGMSFCVAGAVFHFTLYTPNSTLDTPHSTLHTFHSTLNAPHSTL